MWVRVHNLTSFVADVVSHVPLQRDELTRLEVRRPDQSRTILSYTQTPT